MGGTRLGKLAADDTKRDEPRPKLKPWCELGLIFKEDGDVVIERRFGDIEGGERAIRW